MNIIIKNENAKALDALNIETIKSISGQFNVDEIREHVVNLIFNKVIIDITAIKNYHDINNVLAVLRSFDSIKSVLLLNKDREVNNDAFLGRLVESGIYSFTRNPAEVAVLLASPRGSEDVLKYVKYTSKVTEGVPKPSKFKHFLRKIGLRK